MKDFGLYIIVTEPVLSYEEVAKICVEEEIGFLQLREKNLTDRELLTIGRKIRAITKGSNTKFIINDRVDLALLLKADGYHLGQDDIRLKDAEKLSALMKNSKELISGISTHNLQQLSKAEDSDYYGFGPIYATLTKAKPDPVVGLLKLKEALHICRKPIVAIGGIDETNIDEVLEAGAKNLAMVRYFMKMKDLKMRIRNIQRKIKIYSIGE